MTQHAIPPSTVRIDDITLHLSHAVAARQEWIGQAEVLKQLLACWLVVHELDLPLSPRLTGPPGIGKTTLGMAAGRVREQDLYIYQCTSDTRPEVQASRRTSATPSRRSTGEPTPWSAGRWPSVSARTHCCWSSPITDSAPSGGGSI